MPYKAIIFDLDNTILNFELCERQAILGALNLCSISLNGINEAHFLETFETFNSKYWQQRHQLTPQTLIEKSYQDTFSQLQIVTDTFECLSQSYWHIFNNSGALEQNAHPLLTRLSDKYRLAVVTNGLASAQYSRLKAAGLDDFFETVVVSETVGYAKPAPEIFYHALEKLKVGATEVLYIGDSLKYDYAGAKRVGIDFCYYNRKRETIPEDVQPKFVVEVLLDVLKVIL